MPSKIFSLQSSCREFTELKIWAKTNVLKTMVSFADISSKPSILTLRKWNSRMCLYIFTVNSGAVCLSGIRSGSAGEAGSAASARAANGEHIYDNIDL